MYCYVYDYDVCTLSRMYVLQCMYVTTLPTEGRREEANSDCLAGVARGDTLPLRTQKIPSAIVNVYIYTYIHI